MWARFFSCILVLLSLVGVSVSSRPNHHHHHVFAAASNLQVNSIKKIGSKPPRCEHKCYGCMPCEAIQVPTTSSSIHLGVGVLYTNYEPEGWKCKCGPSFYSP